MSQSLVLQRVKHDLVTEQQPKRLFLFCLHPSHIPDFNDAQIEKGIYYVPSDYSTRSLAFQAAGFMLQCCSFRCDVSTQKWEAAKSEECLIFVCMCVLLFPDLLPGMLPAVSCCFLCHRTVGVCGWRPVSVLTVI